MKSSCFVLCRHVREGASVELRSFGSSSVAPARSGHGETPRLAANSFHFHNLATYLPVIQPALLLLRRLVLDLQREALEKETPLMSSDMFICDDLHGLAFAARLEHEVVLIAGRNLLRR